MPRVEVRVSKTGPAGKPTAEVLVGSKITAAQLGAVLQSVTTNKAVFSAAGLRFCGGCKSGLDIWVHDQFDGVVEFEI